MHKTGMLIIGGVAVALIAVAAWFLFPRHAVTPQPDVSVPKLPSIAEGDNIASWNFEGAYADHPELVAKAEAEIRRLSDLIGEGTYPDVTLYVSIANQYELLGNGKQEYDYLGRAIMADPASGLPWHNLGVLMERLGALETARVAYERAVLLQPIFGEIQQP